MIASGRLGSRDGPTRKGQDHRHDSQNGEGARPGPASLKKWQGRAKGDAWVRTWQSEAGGKTEQEEQGQSQ